jgi:hypothetical protein
MAPVKADVRIGSATMRPSHRRPCSEALPRPHQHMKWGMAVTTRLADAPAEQLRRSVGWTTDMSSAGRGTASVHNDLQPKQPPQAAAAAAAAAA